MYAQNAHPGRCVGTRLESTVRLTQTLLALQVPASHTRWTGCTSNTLHFGPNQVAHSTQITTLTLICFKFHKYIRGRSAASVVRLRVEVCGEEAQNRRHAHNAAQPLADWPDCIGEQLERPVGGRSRARGAPPAPRARQALALSARSLPYKLAFCLLSYCV